VGTTKSTKKNRKKQVWLLAEAKAGIGPELCRKTRGKEVEERRRVMEGPRSCRVERGGRRSLRKRGGSEVTDTSVDKIMGKEGT